ncbi:hypothetical protein M5K25_010411 [Dendrobium thyrsiflorum]|uniref:RNase H type-1 domain-containing protein n=1 Tax=Dendrobium thyrsiflorum TaxID=117978 RepID=A0ABD0V0D2_DENTH
MFDANGLIIEGDNLAIIKAMQCCLESRHWERHPLSGEDLNWTRLFHRIRFQHVPREFNLPAHFCAHLALNCNFRWLFAARDTDAIPIEFKNILWDDMVLFSLSFVLLFLCLMETLYFKEGVFIGAMVCCSTILVVGNPPRSILPSDMLFFPPAGGHDVVHWWWLLYLPSFGPSAIVCPDLGHRCVPSPACLGELWTFVFWATVGLCLLPLWALLHPLLRLFGGDLDFRP